MENKDEKLWQLATQRANFKGKILSYLAVNTFLWIIWFFTKNDNAFQDANVIPWPAWVSIGWGLGLVFKYIRIYHTNTADNIQKEYDKLKSN